MSKVIWKFAFDTADVVEIDMPARPEILTVQVQHGQPCIWAIVNPTAEKKLYRFHIYGTGHPIDTFGPTDAVAGKYVGTYGEHGALVFHMFAIGGAV